MSILSYVSADADLTMGYVYKWTNEANGKMYIGSHIGSNPKYTASGLVINHAFRKYGMDNFRRDILYVGPNFGSVEAEILLTIDAMHSSNFYNLVNIYSVGLRKNVITDEAREAQSKRRRGVPHSKSHRENLSKALKGRIHSAESIRKNSESRRGVKDSDETRAKKSAAAMGRKLSQESIDKTSHTKHLKNHAIVVKESCRWCLGSHTPYWF